jgi:hypothetical protein
VISFFSGKTAATTPNTITLSDAAHVAQSQLNALDRAPDVGLNAAATVRPTHHSSWLGWVAIAIGVLGIGDLALISLRKRRRRRLARGSWTG